MAAFLAAGVRTGALQPTIDRVFDLDDIVDALFDFSEQRAKNARSLLAR